MPKHEIAKMRLEARRRKLHVIEKQFLTPHMLRIVFHSDELSGFNSPSPDDHIKIFLPAEGGAPIMRDFTPRKWDIAAGSITLDFALHEHGPAASWARNSQLGDAIEMGGPRGTTVVPDDFDWYLLIGDATALPSIGRRIESLRSGVPARVLALVAGEAEKQEWATTCACSVEWITSTGSLQDDATALVDALKQFEAPQGDGFIWIAAESSVARALYRHVTETRAHPKQWVKAGGYWSHGQADAGERFD